MQLLGQPQTMNSLFLSMHQSTHFFLVSVNENCVRVILAEGIPLNFSIYITDLLSPFLILDMRFQVGNVGFCDRGPSQLYKIERVLSANFENDHLYTN